MGKKLIFIIQCWQLFRSVVFFQRNVFKHKEKIYGKFFFCLKHFIPLRITLMSNVKCILFSLNVFCFVLLNENHVKNTLNRTNQMKIHWQKSFWIFCFEKKFPAKKKLIRNQFPPPVGRLGGYINILAGGRRCQKTKTKQIFVFHQTYFY